VDTLLQNNHVGGAAANPKNCSQNHSITATNNHGKEE